MKTLIAFGSTEGHTRNIASHIKNDLEQKGHSVELFDCGSANERPDTKNFDKIIVAASVHQEAHQPAVVDYVKGNQDALNSQPSAMVSVSLSASFKEGLEEAKRYVSDFAKETGWEPKHVHLAAGAIRFLEYDFFKRFTVQYMVLKGGKMPEDPSGNPEYTDWEALDEFVGEFAKSA